MRPYSAAWFCLIFSCLTMTGAAAKPTRSECIIGFDLDWSHVKDRHGVRKSLFRLLPGELVSQPLAGAAFSDDGLRLYFQFREACDQKQDMAAALIAFWRSKDLELPRFEQISAPITPSPWTIELKGPYWSDVQ